MIGAVAATLLPLGFLIILFGGGAHFLRNNIEQDGEAPIHRTLFYLSKYSILAIWGVMVLRIWGISLSVITVPPILNVIGMTAWLFGFAFLYLGRLEMGGSFRLGTPKEPTSLQVGGLFSVSRNPMYVGVYATVVASALYTLNPIVMVLGAFVIAIHHSIVLAEESHLQKVFGMEYVDYCKRVGRYI